MVDLLVLDLVHQMRKSEFKNI